MSGEGCVLCNVSWKPKHGDIWGPNVKNLLNMKIKVNHNTVYQDNFPKTRLCSCCKCKILVIKTSIKKSS